MEQIKEAVYLINDERYLHLRENGAGVGFATYNKVTGEPLESGQISEKNLPPDGQNTIPAARNWYLFELSDDDRKAIQQESVKILENIPQAGIGRRRIWEPETLPKDIRLINSHYDDLYRIPDGGVIQVDYPDGRSFTARVEHLDDYHFDMGGLGNVFHICQFAEVMERNHADFYPEIQTQDEQAAWELGGKGYLAIQSCEDGWDYTLYHSDYSVMDGGQLDAPGLTLPDAGQEALNLLGQTAAVSEVLLGDKLAAFQEAAEKANEIPAPIKIPDPTAEPTVTILWSESDKLQDGEIMPLSVANRVFEELDTAQHTDREKDGYTGGWYDKTAFRIDFTLNGQPDNYEGRQDFGDGEGSLVQHIQNYHEYYAKDENWKNFVLHNKGPEAWEQDKAEREMVLTEFIPYLKQHCNLSAMEQAATAALREGQNISPEQAAYYNAVVTYVQDCRPLLNQGQYNLPEPPKLADFDQSLQNYKAQVQAEIAQEAAAAGMTVEEYAAAGFEAPQQDSFSIYQLRNEDSTRDYRFEPYDRLQTAGLTVDKANYTEVYAAPLTAGTTLEDIYRTFNVDYPADFKGHSLSVSDVVVLHQNGQDTAHYCDSVGFQQVPEFLRENPLRTAELSTEQNENMIDGVLNNTPSLGELEAKAKAGEQISLTDLAAAVKAEEKAPKAKKSHTAKPKKPSIRAQLDAAKKEQSKQTPPREKTKELEV